MKNVTLKSSYVRLSANGYYRNEVSGNRSASPITLNAVTDLLSRSTVNVNLLTHLEFDRVTYLMAHGGGTLKIKAAKKQAEKEIFNAFHIDAAGFGYSEDLDVFGKTEADAALLAISILLQGDRSEAELTELLTDFSTDFSTDSSWDDLAKRAEIADSALSKDVQGKLATYRSNVEGWGLSTGAVPHFEKYIRRFASVENGLGVCGDDVAVGTVKNVSNKNSKKYYATTYTDVSYTAVRFICANADSAKWRVATDIEKDTMGWAKEFKNAKEGDVHNGKVNTNKTYVYENKNWRKGTKTDSLIGRGCVSSFMNESDSVRSSSYTCTSDGWEFDSVNVLIDPRDKQVYRTIKIGSQYWMAQNLNYEVENSYCYNNSADNCAKYGRLYTWDAAIAACPEDWHLPSIKEWDKLESAVSAVSMSDAIRALQAKGYEKWPTATDAYGFSMLPAGVYFEGRYEKIGSETYFWTPGEDKYGVIMKWFYLDGEGRGSYSKKDGLSVRCVKD